MWQLRIYDMTHFWDGNYHLMELIKEVDEEPNTDDILEIDGKTYRWCALSPENKVVGIQEITFVEEDETEDQEDEKFICPYCLEEDDDAWEMSDDNGTVECSNCGSEIEYERGYTVSYRVYPVKRNKVSVL